VSPLQTRNNILTAAEDYEADIDSIIVIIMQKHN
jgi:hypothetical protein